MPLSLWVTVGTVGFIVLAALVAVSRGVVRQLMGMASLAIAVGAAFGVFWYRTHIFGVVGMSISTEWMLLIAAVAGLLAYFLCKAGMGLLAAFGFLKLFAGMDGWKAGLLSMLPSSFLLWVSSMALRLIGSIDGMENAAEAAKKGVEIESQVKSFWSTLSQHIDNSPLGSLAEKLDPYDIKATTNLARLLILWPEGSMWQRLAAQSTTTASALSHPRIRELGNDPEVRSAIEKQDFVGLMQMRKIQETAHHLDLASVLSGLELEQAMDSIVYGRPQPVRLN